MAVITNMTVVLVVLILGNNTATNASLLIMRIMIIVQSQ